MGTGWLNVASLALGLIAWALPVIGLIGRNKTAHGRGGFSIASFTACSLSLCMQIFYADHLVKIEDWPALMDTSGAVAWVSAVLVTVTIVLNALARAVHRRNR